MLPVCGPGWRTELSLARPSTVQIVASVSMPPGGSAAGCAVAPPCPVPTALVFAPGRAELHPARLNATATVRGNERLAANPVNRR